MTIQRYLLLGAGDLAREIASLLEAGGVACEVAAYSSNPAGVAARFSKRFCTTPEDALRDFPPTEWQAVCCVGAPRVRAAMYDQFRGLGYRFASVLAPEITNLADAVGDGCVVFPGVRLAVGVRLGVNVLINYNAAIGHDCVIGAHSSLSPGVNLGGRIESGERVLYGIGASVVQGRSIGDDAVIASGSSVWNNVADGVTMIGVPGVARQMPGSKVKAAAASGSELNN